MTRAIRDLATMLDIVPTSGLRSLARALRHGAVIRGRFTDAAGGGCLMYWLSEGEVVDRTSRRSWTRSNPFCTDEIDRLARTLIAAWDAALPAWETLKGAGYEAEYPRAPYVLQVSDVRQALAIALRARRQANASEREAHEQAITPAVSH